MTTFTHHSAKAVIAQGAGDGPTEVVFTGLLDARALAALQSTVMRSLRGVRAVVLRYDLAALMISHAPSIDASDYQDAPVMAAVVPVPFLAIATQYAAGLGQLGAIVAVFSDSSAQVALAHQWASRHAPALRSRLLV